MLVKKHIYILMLLIFIVFAFASCKTDEVLPSSALEESSVTKIPETIDMVAATKVFYKALPVDESYFDDAVFIGDSRTQGFIFYNGLSNVIAYMEKGLNVEKALEKPVIEMNGKQLTVVDALAEGKSFNKVYIMLGVNELGWAYSDIFIEKDSELVDKIKEVNPEALIYIQSILPVSEEKSSSDKIYNMDKINEYNALIKLMAEEKGAIYLNVFEAVVNDKGYLPENASTDGVHLKKDYCKLWFDYLKDNAV